MSLVWQSKRRLFAAAAILSFLFIACARGNVGTDTASYQYYMSLIKEGDSIIIEPGFLLISFLVVKLIGDADFAVKCISLLYFVILLYYTTKADNNEIFLLFSYLLPVFSYSYGMNVLRIGLAAAIFLMITKSTKPRNGALKSLYGTASALIQYSSALYSIFLFLIIGSLKRKITWYVLIALLSLISVASFYIENYIGGKIDLYVDFSSPGPFSGLAPVVSVLVIIFFLAFGGLPRREKMKMVVASMIGLVGGYVISKYSYAGLRILDIFEFIIPVCIVVLYNRRNMRLDVGVKFGFLVAGWMLALNTYLNFLGEQGTGPSPFLPYKFFWE